MKKGIVLVVSLIAFQAFSQMFNYGHKDLAFKNLLDNGICYLQTGDSLFDHKMLDALDKYWKISDYTTVEKYERPPKETTALFVTTKEPTKKYMMDRKNQHVLVLQPAKLYKKDKQVPFDQTLGYMYYNGFHEMLAEDEEHLFNRYIIQALNKGLSLIKEKQLHNSNETLNEQIAEEITQQSKGQMGNTLILNREFLVHFIDEDKLKKYDITYRLFAKELFFEALKTSNRTHYLLYYSVNTKTDLSLINLVTGELLYVKHFPEGYTELEPKELKIIADYF
ncbi:MAG: hypothetical protein WDZ35_10125 [Crocinitomicaceae bacterium]